MTLDPRMTGPGRVRPVVARWVVTGELVLTTACHFGGEATGATDMALLRDEREGGPLLPGTTLAGALRDHLLDAVLGFGTADEGKLAAQLFGGDRGDDDGAQSPLILFDSFGKLPADVTEELRDGVAITPKSGTADDHLKFDLELLPPGTVFSLRFELLVGEKVGEERLLGRLTTALAGLSAGAITLGARRSRGLGAITTQAWRARRFDLSNAKGWIDWLTSDALDPLGATERPMPSVREAVEAAAKRAGVKAPRPTTDDHRKQVTFELALRFSGGLLVRSPAATAEGPDDVHLRSGGKAVLPGTSVAGAVRARALRIAHCVGGVGHEARAERLVDDVFGPRLQERQKKDAKASKLRVGECTVTARRSRVTRIRVDRFTQGVTEGALFEEEPLVGATTTLRLTLRRGEAQELGLVLLVVKDLLSGDLPLGGSVAVGRGVCTGTASVSGEGFARALELIPGRAPTGPEGAQVTEAIRALHEWLRRPAEEAT